MPNVSSGEAIFTLLGFVGIYILLGIFFVLLVLRFVAQGPEEDDNPVPADETPRKELVA